MARDVWQKTITSLSGDALDGAQITVRNQQTNALSAIFDAQSGGSQRPNPFLTGADGVARFFAEPGFYKVTAFKDGFGTAEFIWNNLGDNNLRNDMGFAAVGTVSQSGGVPTGAIIQRGSNANGEFVRYADGTMICTRNISFSDFDINQARGVLFDSAPVTGTLPSSFLSANSYVFTFSLNSFGGALGSVFAGGRQDRTSSSSVRVSLMSGESKTGLTFEGQILAIGRWF